MLLGWVKLGLGFVVRFVLRFFFRSFTRAMGCFFACFRIKDNHDRRSSNLISTSTRPADVLISGNSLSSVFQSQEGEDCEINWDDDGLGSQGDELGLTEEAKFLKACGTIAGTPAEIRKASEKLKVSPSCEKESAPPTFHSWLPNLSVEKLKLDVQPFNPPTPINLCQEWGDSTDSSEHTPSCIDSNHEPATDTQRKNKSVRFQCDTSVSSCGSSSDDWHLKKKGSPNNQSANKPSPYPTPLKLSSEMQTPGTDYPATFKELPDGKARVRSQFVYPNNKQGENVFRCKILEEQDFNSGHDSGELSDSSPTPVKGLYKDESKAEVNLSSCLKPSPIDQEERNNIGESAYSHVPHFRKTPADRPIIGVVAANFEYEDSNICPPKLWDGNGIPNTTTKYKEDQKVNWHATPFEERLEKALTDESFIPRRKFVRGKPLPFDDIEESDIALSQLQSSSTSNSESVASF